MPFKSWPLIAAIVVLAVVTGCGGASDDGNGSTAPDAESVESVDSVMVAARLVGPGFDGELAEWAVGGSVTDLVEVSVIFAADGSAKEFSSWGADSPLSQDINATAHGVSEAKDCVEALG